MNLKYNIIILVLGLVAQSDFVFADCGNTISIQYAQKDGYNDVAIMYAPDMDYQDCNGNWAKGYPGTTGGTWDALLESPISIGLWGTSDNLTQGETVSAGANVFVCGHFTHDEIGIAYCNRTQ